MEVRWHGEQLPAYISIYYNENVREKTRWERKRAGDTEMYIRICIFLIHKSMLSLHRPQIHVNSISYSGRHLLSTQTDGLWSWHSRASCFKEWKPPCLCCSIVSLGCVWTFAGQNTLDWYMVACVLSQTRGKVAFIPCMICLGEVATILWRNARKHSQALDSEMSFRICIWSIPCPWQI